MIGSKTGDFSMVVSKFDKIEWGITGAVRASCNPAAKGSRALYIE